MSVIHESLKRARQPKDRATPSGEVPALTVRTGRAPGVRLWWVMLFFVLAEGVLFVRESALRLRAEDKMRQAYLELNDARGNSIEAQKKSAQIGSQAEDLRDQLKKAVQDRADLLRAKRSVETENLEKEKKIAELTKSVHEVEMSKFQLKEEIQALRRELSAKNVSAESPAQPN
jgi:septal ring factor EnvC (AmiA/AmiB activator)